MHGWWRWGRSWASWQGYIPETEILWLHDPTPVDPYRRGSGIIRAQADELETAEYASKHAKAIFWNRALPDIVVMDVDAGDPEIKRHELAWNNRLQGFWRWYKPYFANRKLEFWQPQQMNLENLTMVPLMKHERDTIMQTWGVPPEQFGLTESSNRAVAETGNWIMESRVIEPRRQFLCDELQAKLLPEYDERLVLGFVSTVPENREHQLNVRKAAPWAWMVDEWREFAGDEPLPNRRGQVFVLPLNSFGTEDLADLERRPQPNPGAGRPPAEPAPEAA